MKEAFIERRFRKDSLDQLSRLNGIAAEYAAKGMRLTVRQLFYQGVARGFIENTEKEYQKTIRLCTDAREAGLLDWDCIEDRAREVVTRPSWTSPGEILRAAADSYHEDRWDWQDWRVIVVLEKSALAGILESVCFELDTPLLAARGYSSATLFYEIARKQIVPTLERGQGVTVLHLGDHDPSGIDMTRDLRERLSLYARTQVDVQRIALTMEQVEEINPPPNPAKESDRRFEAYRKQFGDRCWELDAMPPDVLSDITTKAIKAHIESDAWDLATDRIETRRQALASLASRGANPC